MVLRVQSLRLLEACVQLEEGVAKMLEGRRCYTWPWQWCGSGTSHRDSEEPIKPSFIQIVTSNSQAEASDPPKHQPVRSTDQPLRLHNGQLREPLQDRNSTLGNDSHPHAGVQHCKAAANGLHNAAQGTECTSLDLEDRNAAVDGNTLSGDNSHSKQLPKVLNADALPDKRRKPPASGQNRPHLSLWRSHLLYGPLCSRTKLTRRFSVPDLPCMHM